ncbi:hypothetical protein Tco_0367079 [Tanacetum coccineum]
MLRRNRRAQDRTARLMETEAILSHEDWAEICRVTGNRPYLTSTAHRATNTDEDTADTAPKRTTRSTPATTTNPTTSMTNAQLKALIDQGIANALAARDADRSQNGEDNHDSGTGVRRQAPPARECTYPDFMKCKPLYFKGTEGVVELT